MTICWVLPAWQMGKRGFLPAAVHPDRIHPLPGQNRKHGKCSVFASFETAPACIQLSRFPPPTAPCFKAASRQAYRRRRQTGDPLAAAGKPEPLGRRRLDRDAADVKAGDLRHAGAHRLAVRADLGRFADQRRSRWTMKPPRGAHPLRGMGHKTGARRPLPLRIGRREMRADVALGERAVNRVGERVERDVRVGVAG